MWCLLLDDNLVTTKPSRGSIQICTQAETADRSDSLFRYLSQTAGGDDWQLVFRLQTFRHLYFLCNKQSN